MSRLPIRVRLTLAFALAMAVVLAAVGGFLYVRLGSTLDERIDDALESRASALAAVFDDGSGPALDTSAIAGEEGLVQVVIDREVSVAVVAGSPGFESEPLASPSDLLRAREGTLVLERELAGGTSLDEVRLRMDAVGGLVTIVGESLDDRDDALDALLAQLLVILPVGVLLSAAIGYVVAGAALRPVEAMRRRAEEITAETPERRLPLPSADDEVRRLGDTLNEMLARLDAGLARERRFVADASHELRTPLALLQTELQLALRRPRTAVELRDAIRSAADETDRLVKLAEDLLLVSRSDQGRLPVRPRLVRARTLLAGVAARFAGPAADAGRAVEVDCPEALELRVDPDRIQQALGNLVDNAARHGDGVIQLAATESDERIELHVTDEGPGFPPDFLPHAFERFSRNDEARSRGGTGLGLAIVAAVAQAHGGSARAANRVGGGADVWLTLSKPSDGADEASRDGEDVR